MEEKRNYPRTQLKTTINYSGKRGETRDISLSGLSFTTNEKIVEGSNLNLHFNIMKVGTLKLSGEVVWSRGARLNRFQNGLHFKNVNKAEQLLLSKYINNRLNTELERRKHRRLVIDVLVNYSFGAKATTKNIDSEGMCLYTKDPIKNGDFVITTVELPAGDKVTAHSKVLWNKKIRDGMHENGLRFWSIEAVEKIKLLQYIRILTSNAN